MSIKSILTLLTFPLCFFSFAQQDPLLTNYWNNLSFFNPAATGLDYKHQAAANYRNQWDKVNGAPNTLVVGYNTQIDKVHGGLGFNYQYETIGFNRNQRVDLNYAYHFDLGNERKISAGISAGFLQNQVDADWIVPTVLGDPALPSKDRNYGLVSNIGMVYTGQLLNVGISSTQFLSAEIKSTFYSPIRQYIFFTAYNLNVGDRFVLKPQFLARTDTFKISADLSILAKFNNRYWAGLGFRTSDAIYFSAGWDIKEKYRVGYSYDHTINQLSTVSRGTHEIVLGFLLK